jgi:hypothetical protein
MRKLTGNGMSGMVGGLRSPMAKDSHGLIKKGSLKPPVCPNTMRTDISVGGANVRSAQTGGKVVKPF